jgi:hypothetical protein
MADALALLDSLGKADSRSAFDVLLLSDLLAKMAMKQSADALVLSDVVDIVYAAHNLQQLLTDLILMSDMLAVAKSPHLSFMDVFLLIEVFRIGRGLGPSLIDLARLLQPGSYLTQLLQPGSYLSKLLMPEDYAVKERS